MAAGVCMQTPKLVTQWMSRRVLGAQSMCVGVAYSVCVCVLVLVMRVYFCAPCAAFYRPAQKCATHNLKSHFYLKAISNNKNI